MFSHFPRFFPAFPLRFFGASASFPRGPQRGPVPARYAQLDFTTLDQRLGTVEELRALTSEAHRLGMYVIIDVAADGGRDGGMGMGIWMDGWMNYIYI